MSTREEQLLNACERGELQTVKELLDSKAIDPNRVVEQRHRLRCRGWLTEGWTPLHYASMQGHLEVIKFLSLWFSAKSSVNTRDKEYGMTPLHYACWAGHLEVVKILFSNSKLDANAKDTEGRTPLHLACMSKHHKVVQCLISNAKLSDDVADYALHWAFRKGAKNHEVIVILAEQGIKQTKPPDLQNENSKTCKICYKDFNIGRKQYQCHICWDEVCAACSKHKVAITDQSFKPERVCDTCFDILSILRKKRILDTMSCTNIKPADSEVIGTTAQAAEADMTCPVCLHIQVDPCTLPSCGHSICQLCLARLWKNDEKSCPVCKKIWREFPAISYNFKANIEGSYGHEVAQLRKEYTQEDKELIKEVLEAKASSSQKSDTFAVAQKITPKEELGEAIFVPPRTLPEGLNSQQLAVWLSDDPRFMGTDYQHDIRKLKEAKIYGDNFLSLDKGSLEQYGLSPEFQTTLIKIIKELKTHRQRSSAYNVASTTATKVQQQSHSSTIGQQLLPVWKLPGVEECGETSVVVHSSQGQLVNWNGLKLHIHEGSLPEGLQQCTIYIIASLAGEYEISENTSLVSAIYWLRCEPQCTFTKPITVEIQHCSTKQELSKLKIVRAFCSQKPLPYKFNPLVGGRFDADTSYGAVEVTSFSGFCVAEESPVSERRYYSQLFYSDRSYYRKRHEIHIIFAWNTEAHINYVANKYCDDGFIAGCYRIVELDDSEDLIKVGLETAKWTKVMDGQWEIQPAKPMVTKAELDDFKPGRGLPNCVLEARPLCEDFPQLLCKITLSGIKPPHHELILSYMPSNSMKEISRTASRDSESDAGEGKPMQDIEHNAFEHQGVPINDEKTTIRIQDVAARAGIDRPDTLNQECSQKLLLNLAKHCVDWELIGFYLELTKADIGAVKEDCQTAEQKRVEMLRRWKEKFSFNATYRAFIQALLLCGKASDAFEACKTIASGTGVPIKKQIAFNRSMSQENFFKWLESRGVSEEDCKTLSGHGITPSGFTLLDAEDFDDLGLTKVGKKLLLKTLKKFATDRDQ